MSETEFIIQDPEVPNKQVGQTLQWKDMQPLSPLRYLCGHCGNKVASDKGYGAGWNVQIYICPQCHEPTYKNLSYTLPGELIGEEVSGLPEMVRQLYQETRQCTTVSAYTASLSLARILLIHIAIERGADEGSTFQQCVNYLQSNFLPPKTDNGWVDQIRKMGNEVTHDFKVAKKIEAQNIILFLEFLLKILYELPAKIKKG